MHFTLLGNVYNPILLFLSGVFIKKSVDTAIAEAPEVKPSQRFLSQAPVSGDYLDKASVNRGNQPDVSLGSERIAFNKDGLHTGDNCVVNIINNSSGDASSFSGVNPAGG